jgi:hypothetical protein
VLIGLSELTDSEVSSGPVPLTGDVAAQTIGEADVVGDGMFVLEAPLERFGKIMYDAKAASEAIQNCCGKKRSRN